MKKILILFLLFPSIANGAEFFEPFSTRDTIMQTAFISLVCLDWAQTIKFSSEGKREGNRFLGEYPSKEKIDRMIFTGIVTHSLLVWAIPGDARFVFQYISVGLELFAVKSNYEVGVRIGYWF